MTALDAIILGLIEGLTEFLPVSSTGHMILAESLMKIHEDAFTKTFTIAIQLGAIAAVFFVYFNRFLRELRLYFLLAAAFLPTGIIGLLLYKKIKALLFNPVSVSIALIAGGVILLFFDRLARHRDLGDQEITPRRAFFIGMFQTLSLIPGVSRAAATIGGGLVMGLNQVRAVEFSFLLAVPTMVVATGYDLYKERAVLSATNLDLLAIGGVVAFISALLAVRFFLKFIARHGFFAFGVYRIIVGIVFLFYGVVMPALSK